jgi:hypothetical protein
MSADTSWSMRRSCMTETDCEGPPRWGSTPAGSEILEYLCTYVVINREAGASCDRQFRR